jgi:hypothetical protein
VDKAFRARDVYYIKRERSCQDATGALLQKLTPRREEHAEAIAEAQPSRTPLLVRFIADGAGFPAGRDD